MAAEAASLSTETDSMSLGLSIAGSPSTPSISTRADPPAPIDVLPRMLYDAERLGLPSASEILRLGTAPCNICVTLATGRFSRSSEETWSTAPVRLAFFCVP